MEEEKKSEALKKIEEIMTKTSFATIEEIKQDIGTLRKEIDEEYKDESTLSKEQKENRNKHMIKLITMEKALYEKTKDDSALVNENVLKLKKLVEEYNDMIKNDGSKSDLTANINNIDNLLKKFEEEKIFDTLNGAEQDFVLTMRNFVKDTNLVIQQNTGKYPEFDDANIIEEQSEEDKKWAAVNKLIESAIDLNVDSKSISELLEAIDSLIKMKDELLSQSERKNNRR